MTVDCDSLDMSLCQTCRHVEVHVMFLPLLLFVYCYVCHVLSCDVHVTSCCHSSPVHLFGVDTGHWYCPPLQGPTKEETGPSCTAALFEAVLQCVSLEEVVLENCSFGMKVVRQIGMC